VLDPQIESAIRARIEDAPFARWMGIELASIDEGSAEFRLRMEPHHRNPGGIAHGGVIASMLDAAIGLALRTKMGTSSTHVTVQLQVNYLKPIREGAMIARGTAVYGGSRMGYGEGTLLDENGTVLARANATFLVVASSPPEVWADGKAARGPDATDPS
jgi:uncharacterized protein (TIGR00369 family)